MPKRKPYSGRAELFVRKRTGWHKIRAAVLERDSHQCRVCHTPTADVHHWIRRTYPRPMAHDDFDNLVALCRRHYLELRARQAMGQKPTRPRKPF